MVRRRGGLKVFDEEIFKNRVAFMKSHIYAVWNIFVCVIIYNIELWIILENKELDAGE